MNELKESSIIKCLEKYRLNNDFSSFDEEEVLTTIKVGKPSKQTFFRVHASQEMRMQTALLKVEEENEWYLVDPEIWKEVGSDISPVLLLATVNLDKQPLLWPIKLPGPDGRRNYWTESALAAADQAISSWIRLVPDMSANQYKVYKATGNLGDPVWPEEDLKSLIETAFKERFIKSKDHPVVRKLLGGQL